ncbi:DinB family protein [Flavobacterium sp. Fl-77]|uniref:DinB family protein n=1 Tax=Flavobacterium flavipigmentatum TaxID=2893884 RepID=A0AAJ2S5J8_9FLAO|nr:MULTISPECIES: DinB family protein [unclassified Flavobacterium]MDX6180756.1 DinB family protein [Flavobacterium sp. Fl-33]MDX6184356.1 DinB family protein [Flavobacterium sp. Fl-77]UFH39465.1 DinB family protein [Flavobacterium sp. F-70]
MKSVLEVHKTLRSILIKVLDSHSLEQLNKIPNGFNNNLIWNIGHCVATQQVLVYKLSGLPTLASDEFIEKYKKGTKPEGDVSQEEVAEIRGLLSKTAEQTEEDFRKQLFVSYNVYTTSMGFTLSNVEDGLSFNNYHEGIHTGIIMNIRKLV